MGPRLSLTNYIVKAGTAAVLSLSMAALGCLMGCMQPAFANTRTVLDAPSTWEGVAGSSQPGPMADADNCHQTGGHSSGRPIDKKPTSNLSLSCCSLEVTVIQKWGVAKLAFAPTREQNPSALFRFVLSRFTGSPEPAQTISHSGRDTLLETSLLRI